MDKVYVLFQFENEKANYSKLFAQKFKFVMGTFQIKKEIENYFKVVSEEMKADIFKILKDEKTFGRELTYSEYKELVDEVEYGSIIDWEFISKEDYKLWKQSGNAEKPIIFS